MFGCCCWGGGSGDGGAEGGINDDASGGNVAIACALDSVGLSGADGAAELAVGVLSVACRWCARKYAAAVTAARAVSSLLAPAPALVISEGVLAGIEGVGAVGVFAAPTPFTDGAIGAGGCMDVKSISRTCSVCS